jgi:pyridoxine 5-phosphate synthase
MPARTGRSVAAVPEVVELNVGHFLVGEAVFIGWVEAIRRMRKVMDAGRRDLARPDHG